MKKKGKKVGRKHETSKKKERATSKTPKEEDSKWKEFLHKHSKLQEKNEQ